MKKRVSGIIALFLSLLVLTGCPHSWEAASKLCKNGSHLVHDGGSFGHLGDPVADTVSPKKGG